VPQLDEPDVRREVQGVQELVLRVLDQDHVRARHPPQPAQLPDDRAQAAAATSPVGRGKGQHVDPAVESALEHPVVDEAHVGRQGGARRHEQDLASPPSGRPAGERHERVAGAPDQRPQQLPAAAAGPASPRGMDLERQPTPAGRVDPRPRPVLATARELEDRRRIDRAPARPDRQRPSRPLPHSGRALGQGPRPGSEGLLTGTRHDVEAHNQVVSVTRGAGRRHGLPRCVKPLEPELPGIGEGGVTGPQADVELRPDPGQADELHAISHGPG
jgi:hypothetical protein